MSSDDLAYWHSRRIRSNPDAVPEPAAGHPETLRITPYPAPLVLSEPPHDGERLVYVSFLTSAPEIPGFAAYSMPLPYTGNRRIEADFVALMSNGAALIEVKGGIVQVDSRPAPSVRWAHWTRSGNPTGKHVSPSQLFRVADAFSAEAQAKAGVDLGSRIAQLMVFPHTSRAHIDPTVLARLYPPDRDFMRIVFAEDLAEFGMWRLIEDELLRPGRGYALAGNDVVRLVRWIKGELDVQPGPATPTYAPPDFDDRYGIAPPRNKRPEFSVAPPRDNGPPPTPAEMEALKQFLEREHQKQVLLNPPPPLPKRRPQPQPRYWINKLGIGLAILLGIGIWVGRSSEAPVPPPAAATPMTASAPARPTPTIDPFQIALTKAIGEPDKRVAAGDKDWVRTLGPVTGRPGCQFTEMSYSGKVFNVVACRDSERGAWRY